MLRPCSDFCYKNPLFGFLSYPSLLSVGTVLPLDLLEVCDYLEWLATLGTTESNSWAFLARSITLLKSRSTSSTIYRLRLDLPSTVVISGLKSNYFALSRSSLCMLSGFTRCI